jgi:PadR family transcriptional regulator, regulatory protein PadR
MSDIFRDIFLAFVRVHLLHHAAEARIYGLEMIQELARHGYDLSPGTLYPILHGLEEAGYLTSEQETVSGKVRKYYRITGEGRQMLAEVRLKIRELVGEVMEESHPAAETPAGSAEPANANPKPDQVPG